MFCSDAEPLHQRVCKKERAHEDEMRSAGLQLCRALLAFGEGRYAEAMALFLPLRHNNQIVGASHAQREIFALYLIVAAIRSGNPSMAQALLRERAILKPGSAITDRLLQATA